MRSESELAVHSENSRAFGKSIRVHSARSGAIEKRIRIHSGSSGRLGSEFELSRELPGVHLVQEPAVAEPLLVRIGTLLVQPEVARRQDQAVFHANRGRLGETTGVRNLEATQLSAVRCAVS